MKEILKNNIMKIYVIQLFLNIAAVFYILVTKELKIMYLMFLVVLLIMAIAFIIICFKAIVSGIQVNIHKHINF